VQYRPLGKTGLSVSEIADGAWGIGGSVIAGMRTVRNVERNAAVGDGRGLSAGQQAIVAKHRWERNFYAS
jgi:aryl-alcohol dehydrogenase-like predicted oxidoreductase